MNIVVVHSNSGGSVSFGGCFNAKVHRGTFAGGLYSNKPRARSFEVAKLVFKIIFGHLWDPKTQCAREHDTQRSQNRIFKKKNLPVTPGCQQRENFSYIEEIWLRSSTLDVSQKAEKRPKYFCLCFQDLFRVIIVNYFYNHLC